MPPAQNNQSAILSWRQGICSTTIVQPVCRRRKAPQKPRQLSYKLSNGVGLWTRAISCFGFAADEAPVSAATDQHSVSIGVLQAEKCFTLLVELKQIQEGDV